jgi:hypothetical protein
MSLSQHVNKKDKWSQEDGEALARFNVSPESAPRNLMYFGKKLCEVIAGPQLLIARNAPSAVLMEAKGKVSNYVDHYATPTAYGILRYNFLFVVVFPNSISG